MTESNSGPAERLYYGYIVLGAAVVIQLVGWGTFGAFGVFFSPFQDQFGWSRASISGVASAVLLVSGFFSVIMGNLSDKLGPRRVMPICGIVFALGAFLTSRISSLWQLYLSYGLVLGIGVSAFDVVILSTIARWFTFTRGVMTGIVKAGAGLGHLTIPFLAGMFIAARGWRDAYAALAIMNVVVVVVVSQFLKRDPGKSLLESAHGRSPRTVLPEHGLTLRQSTHRWQFWSVVAINFVILFCTYTIQIHIAPHAIDLGNSVTQAAGILSVIGAASVVGRFAMGGIGDRIGVTRALMICCGLLVAALSSLAVARQAWLLYLIVPFYGFAHGGSYSLISPMVAGFFGTSSHGSIYGFVNFGGTIGGAIGPILAGYIFDRTTSYSTVFLIMAVAAAAGLTLVATLKPLVLKGEEYGQG